MKNKTLLSLLFVFFYFTNSFLFAQNNNVDVKATDFTKDNKVGELLKADDKMIAVIIVISIILIGLFIYLWRIEKKIDKLKP
jgi:CcmD family protein